MELEPGFDPHRPMAMEFDAALLDALNAALEKEVKADFV